MEYIDGTVYKKMILASLKSLHDREEYINSLNVFPVPDGDTGTNMYLTFRSAAEAVKELNSPVLCRVAETVSRASMRGARGNSGVILSQIFRGLAEGMDGRERVGCPGMMDAICTAADTAYKAVMKPVEGTILTVMRKVAEEAETQGDECANLIEMFVVLVETARESLEHTPELLPTLKEAGVVDAGGQGLVCMFESWLEVLRGRTPDELSWAETEGEFVKPQSGVEREADIEEELEADYCTEFLVRGDNLFADRLREQLASHGSSLLVVGSGTDLLRVHIHTDHPGHVLEEAISCGQLEDIKIDNMHLQHREEYSPPVDGDTENACEKREGIGIVAVAVGSGIQQIFSDLGVDQVVHGGQTMNPSTEELAQAVDSIPQQEVLLLPNNGNIISAAEQVQSLSEKRVTVVPSTDIPQGISALIFFDEQKDLRENKRRLTAALKEVKSAEVTYAIRDTEFSGEVIREGDYIGIRDGEIVAVDGEPEQVVCLLLEELVDDQNDLITVYTGEEVDEYQKEGLRTYIEEEYPFCDLEMYSGGQPLYSYLLSVE